LIFSIHQYLYPFEQDGGSDSFLVSPTKLNKLEMRISKPDSRHYVKRGSKASVKIQQRDTVVSRTNPDLQETAEENIFFYFLEAIDSARFTELIQSQSCTLVSSYIQKENQSVSEFRETLVKCMQIGKMLGLIHSSILKMVVQQRGFDRLSSR
jgi:hypothetical protein